MFDVTTVRFNPISLFVTVTLALGIRAPVLSVTVPVMAPVGTCAQTIPRVTSANARTNRMQFFMQRFTDWNRKRWAPQDNHNELPKYKGGFAKTFTANLEAWLTGFVEPDATDQLRKTRVTAQGIKVGMRP